MKQEEIDNGYKRIFLCCLLILASTVLNKHLLDNDFILNMMALIGGVLGLLGIFGLKSLEKNNKKFGE